MYILLPLNLVAALAAGLLISSLLKNAPLDLAHPAGWWIVMISFYPTARALDNWGGSTNQTGKRKVSFVRWLVVWSLGAVALFLIDYFGTMFFNEIVVHRLLA
jgi:hypothetical protein